MTLTIETRSRKRTFSPEQSEPLVQISKKIKSASPWNQTSQKVNAIWSAGLNRSEFANLWNASDRETKREFVTLLDNDSSRRASKMKSLYVNIIYIAKKRLFRWPSQDDPAFYHATRSIENVLGILKDREIKVMAQKGLSGAFVSTKPELGFGDFIFVLNQSIERLNPLNTVFQVNGPGFWAGYANPIPVTEETLVKIVINYRGAFFEDVIAKIKSLAWEGLVIERFEFSATHTFIVPREWS